MCQLRWRKNFLLLLGCEGHIGDLMVILEIRFNQARSSLFNGSRNTARWHESDWLLWWCIETYRWRTIAVNFSVSIQTLSQHILINTESNETTIPVLLDLSAVFDTVHHKTLSYHLERYFGLTGTVLQWFQSYLECLQQSVSINGMPSKPYKIFCALPQGFVLGSILFTMYTYGLSYIMRKHKRKVTCQTYYLYLRNIGRSRILLFQWQSNYGLIPL